MKSAYELAMERLEKDSPSGPALSDEQKTQLAEVDNRIDAKIAERKILSQNEMKQTMGNPAEMESINARMQQDIHRLETEREEQKDAVRKGA
ncbi:MAG: hypothetical protein P9L94_12040 [Candidatus Hinthialibacter antarcticus]|nr:hypothetical protein [Candidatus Hinthialibacter antarcticus]